MILRLRGATHRDIEITERTLIPSMTELLDIDGEWFRVVNVIRALRTNDEDVCVGYDIAVVVNKVVEPDRSDWAKRDG